MTRYITALLLGTTMLAAPAMAADTFTRGSTKDAPEVVVTSSDPISWGGAYVGAVAGFGVGTGENDMNLFSNEDERSESIRLHSDDELSGALYGAAAGFNYQRERWVLGLEAELDFTDMEGTSTAPGVNNMLVTETEINWLAVFKARLGVASGNTLFYAWGGPVWADAESNARLTDGVSESVRLGGVDDSRLGWAAGLGIDHAIDRNTFARVEYGHYDLGKEKATSGVSFDGEDTGISFAHGSRIDFDAIKIGIFKKF